MLFSLYDFGFAFDTDLTEFYCLFLWVVFGVGGSLVINKPEQLRSELHLLFECVTT